MGFRGGGQIDPPQRILVFKYPSRDRVNSLKRMFIHFNIFNSDSNSDHGMILQNILKKSLKIFLIFLRIRHFKGNVSVIWSDPPWKRRQWPINNPLNLYLISNMETIVNFIGFNSDNSNMFSCSWNAQVTYVCGKNSIPLFFSLQNCIPYFSKTKLKKQYKI